MAELVGRGSVKPAPSRFYDDLPPRHYRFRVMASNNSGVWNEAGDSLDFSIDPAYYQTTWFRASCVAAFFALLWALYRYRLYQIGQEFNARLEERVGERTRIARELHDTLLQSFQGSLLVMQSARNLFPGAPNKQRKPSMTRSAWRREQSVKAGMRFRTYVRSRQCRAIWGSC